MNIIESFFDNLFASIGNVMALFLAVGTILLILHFIIQGKAQRKRRRIDELKKRIHAKLDLDEAAKAKLKEFGDSAVEAALMGAAASGMSLFDIYSNSGDHSEVMEILNLAGDQAGVAGETTLNVMSDSLEVADNVPMVAAAIFGLKSVKNLARLGKGKQTAREAGINISMDFARIGVGGAGAYSLGKLGALAGTAVYPGVGTIVGGGIGVFAGSLVGSQMINVAKEKLKWGKILKAQEYFGSRLVTGQTPEFIDNFTLNFFDEENLKSRLAEEKILLAEHADELDIYSSKKVSVQAVLTSEYVDYLENMLKKTEYVRNNLLDSIKEVCNTLASSLSGKKALINSVRLAGELTLQNPQYLVPKEEEKALIAGYQSQQAHSKDYPTRFESDENVLETLALQLFNKCVIEPPKDVDELKNTFALSLGIVSFTVVMVLLMWSVFF